MKAITTLTGLTPEVLRAWERRYAGITPARSDNGRRRYSQDDLEKLTLLANLTRNGHAIGKIAGLDCDALRNLQTLAPANESDSQHMVNQVIEAVLSYRIEQCEQLLKRALLACEPLSYVSEILLPTLKKIGDLWHEERLNVAQEQLFSCCIRKIILSYANNLPVAGLHQPSLMFATPSGEPHEFGILTSSLLAALQQCRCIYLGADLPGKDIAEAARHLKPDVIVFGLTKNPPEPQTIKQLEVVLASDLSTTIWLGGTGTEAYQPLLKNSLPVELINNIQHFYEKVQRLKLLV